MATPSNTVTPCSPLQVVSLQGSGKCMAEYIWIGSSGADLKSRTVVLEERPSSPEELPIAEIDGSTYGQAAEEHCEIYLQPRKIFPDPFRGGDHILVLCDIYVPPMACDAADAWDNLAPHSSNHRAACEAVLHQAAYQQPLFSMQQDYSLYSGGVSFEGVTGSGFGGLGSAPLPIKGMPAGLSSKASARLGRDVAELHMQACLAAGISYCGSHNSSSHQWAFKVGPCAGIDAADQLCVGRFLLGRVAEHSGAEVFYDSSGLHGPASSKVTISFSTATSRDPISGLSEVQCMMERLHTSHLQHALCFSPSHTPPVAVAVGAGSGSPHSSRPSGGSWHSARDAFGVGDAPPAGDDGKPPSGPPSFGSSGSGAAAAAGFPSCAFTVGVGNKHASIMVPTSTLINRCGPILDRRPPANSDPYLAVMLLVSSACGIKLPIPQLDAVQLAAALASMAAAAGSSGAVMVPPAVRSCGSSGAVPIPAGGAGSVGDCCPSSLSLEDASLLGASSCSYGSSMLLSGSADSRDVLLSELDRLDGYCRPARSSSAHHRAGGGLAGMKRSHSSGNDVGGDVCSDASSPPCMPAHLMTAAMAADMYYQ